MRAASLLALMGVFDLVGTTASGWLSDRWTAGGCSPGTTGCAGCRSSSCRSRSAARQTGLWVFAVWYGLDWIATVPPTLRLATDAFGAERAPIMFGWIGAGHQVGAALTAFGAGWIRTTLGDYQLAFWGSGALCLLAAALALQVGRRRRARLAGAGRPVEAAYAPAAAPTAGRERLTSTPQIPPCWATFTTCFCDARARIATPSSFAANPITV